MRINPEAFSDYLVGRIADYLSFLIPKQRNTLRQYLLVLALTTFALLARLIIAPLDGGVQYVTFFPAVALSAVIGGLWPGLFSAALGMTMATFLFWPPYKMFTFDFHHQTVMSNTVFLLDAILVCASIEAMHRYYHNFVDALEERKRMEAILQNNQKDLNRAQEVSHVGNWRLDTRHNVLSWSDENYRIFGIPKGNSLTYETFLSTVHPEDREYVDRMWKAALHGNHYDIEHRLLVDGKVKWVRERAELEFDPQGACLGGFGTTQDITEKKQAEEAVAEREREFHALADNVPDNIVRCDREGRFLYINKALEVTQGRPAAELIGKTIEENFPDGRFAALDEAIRRVGTSGESIDLEQIVHAPDGEPHYLMIRIVAEQGPDGKPASVLAVGRDLSAQKKIEEELHLAHQRKDEFIAMLAHELRNPLVPIRNAAHVLGRPGLDESKFRWAHELIERQVDHLTRLVDDLMDVSRIMRGKIILKKEEVKFADLAARVLEAARPMLENKEHQLIVSLPEETVRLNIDPVRVTQVLLNLLDNAAKYSPNGGKIEFNARVTEQEIEIQVRDRGLGIPAALLPHVFEMFQQGEHTLDRAQGGLGIGLTLVQRLVEMHGGQVEASSNGPGRGATFTVRLPIMTAPSSVPAQDEGEIGHLAPGIRVLVVDDDPDVADSTAVLLEMVGYEVRIVASGQAALELVPLFRPHGVLLDIGLKDMDGFETARRLRKIPEGRDLSLLAVTGYGDEETRTAALEAGCDHHLVKPVNIERLIALLPRQAILGSRE